MSERAAQREEKMAAKLKRVAQPDACHCSCGLWQQRGGESKQKRRAALVRIGGVLGGMAPASNGGKSAPGRNGPGADAPLARRRPGYPLVGCAPAEPTSVSPGGRRLPARGLRCKAKEGTQTGRVLAKAVAATASEAGPSRRNHQSGADSHSFRRHGSLHCCSPLRVCFNPINP